MTAPKVFGREMTRCLVCSDDGAELWQLYIGVFRLELVRLSDSKFHGKVHRPCAPFIPHDAAAESELITWLESTARRIMRECFEIAGELEAAEVDFCHVDGLTDTERRIPVRFKDD